MFCRRSASLGPLLFVVMAIGLLGSVSPNLIRRLQQTQLATSSIAPKHTQSHTASNGGNKSVASTHKAAVTVSTAVPKKKASRLVIILVAVVVLLVIVALIAFGLINCGTDSVASASATGAKVVR